MASPDQPVPATLPEAVEARRHDAEHGSQHADLDLDSFRHELVTMLSRYLQGPDDRRPVSGASPA